MMTRGTGVPGPAGNGSRTGPADVEYTLPVIKAYVRARRCPPAAGAGAGIAVSVSPHRIRHCLSSHAGRSDHPSVS